MCDVFYFFVCEGFCRNDFCSNSLTKSDEFPAFQARATGHVAAFASTFAAEPTSVFHSKYPVFRPKQRFLRADSHQAVHYTSALWLRRHRRRLHPRLPQHCCLPGMAITRRGDTDGRVRKGRHAWQQSRPSPLQRPHQTRLRPPLAQRSQKVRQETPGTRPKGAQQKSERFFFFAACAIDVVTRPA